MEDIKKLVWKPTKKKTKYFHSLHQQLWIYMSNPYIVREFFATESERIALYSPLKTMRLYVLHKYMKIENFPYNYCYPCDAAIHNPMIIELPVIRCEGCPIHMYGCTSKECDYYEEDENARYLLYLFKEKTHRVFDRYLLNFCEYAQKIAFAPIKPKAKNVYEIL